MKLSPRLRVLLGVITAGLFLMTGIAFASEGKTVFAGILLMLAAYRSYVLVRQIRWLLASDTDAE